MYSLGFSYSVILNLNCDLQMLGFFIGNSMHFFFTQTKYM